MNCLDAYNKWGLPEKESSLVLWDVPNSLEIGVIPKRIYCNKLLITPLTKAFQALIDTNKVSELKTWDGCFNVRPIRGYEKKYKDAISKGNIALAMKYLSLHAYGLAIDVNSAWNQLGKPPQLSKEFVECFTNNGFEWGGHFKRLDGMHFQIKNI